jgi:acyl-CoA dehydrogenase
MVGPAERRERGVVRSEEVRIKLQRAARETGVSGPHADAKSDGRRLDIRRPHCKVAGQ